jgi:GH25 family lysozyme M1 (1,4-beta-N-acetylmuramidase)
MSAIIGIDCSHWQDIIDWRKASQAGVKFAYIKAGQGASHRDSLTAYHRAGARAAGIKVGAYHFVTQDNALKQAENFRGVMMELGDWDLPPAMDCEPYTSYQGDTVSLRELMTYAFPRAGISGVTGSATHSVEDADSVIIHPYVRAEGERFDLSYPTEPIIDVIGLRLINWYGSAVIYTNPASGNRIFTKPIIGERYPLWIAHWGANPPVMPKVWKGRQFLAHQMGVVDGAEYGVRREVDLDHWGKLRPFPGSPQPPPDDDYLDCRVTTNSGVYSGRLHHE